VYQECALDAELMLIALRLTSHTAVLTVVLVLNAPAILSAPIQPLLAASLLAHALFAQLTQIAVDVAKAVAIYSLAPVSSASTTRIALSGLLSAVTVPVGLVRVTMSAPLLTSAMLMVAEHVLNASVTINASRDQSATLLVEAVNMDSVLNVFLTNTVETSCRAVTKTTNATSASTTPTAFTTIMK